MKKQEIIEKYGEEAYKRHREVAKQWKVSHKEYYAAQSKEYREKNKDKLQEYHRNYKEVHKEEIKSYNKKYIQEHKDKLYEKRKVYCNTTQNGRSMDIAKNYSRCDKANGKGESTITALWIREHIFNSSCIYCGDSDWHHLGCDRIDNDKPHTPENVVCACGICNAERADHFTVSEFIEYRKTHPRKIDCPKEPILNEDGCIKVRKPNSYFSL